MMERHITLVAPPSEGAFADGRKVVAVVGIDRYHAWPTLNNAVSDAKGALGVFLRLGFEQITEPLIDGAATADAIRHLATDELATLSGDDSLVLFVAGHGHTQTRTLQSGSVQTGYLIPVDGDRPKGRAATWIRLDTWLSDVARLPARHILVILDACHSGIALGSLIKWRSGGASRDDSLDELRRRQSRRVITSALANQHAMDGGPIDGHSLFTGCLIEGLTGGLARHGRHEATASEIGVYVQQRVTSYPGSLQTPDFGTLELDNRGELVVPIVTDWRPPQPIPDPPIDTNLVDRSQSLKRRVGAVAGENASAAPIKPLKRVALLDRRLAAELIISYPPRAGSRRVDARSQRSILYALSLYNQLLIEDHFGSALADLIRGDDLLSEAILFLPREISEESTELSTAVAEACRAWLNDPGFQLAASTYGRSKGSLTESPPDAVAYLQRMLLLARRFDAAVIPHPDRCRLYHHWFEGGVRAPDAGQARTVIALPEPARAAEMVSARRSALIAQLGPRPASGAPQVCLVQYQPIVYPVPAAYARQPGSAALAAHQNFTFEFCTAGLTEVTR
jgi:uncharacterized caspase-like protein